jgi:hypothetical protein
VVTGIAFQAVVIPTQVGILKLIALQFPITPDSTDHNHTKTKKVFGEHQTLNNNNQV